MTLKGIIFKNGVHPAKDSAPLSLLKDDVTAVFIDDLKDTIFLWNGRKARMTDKFKAARLAHMLNWKLFGGAGKIVQSESEVKSALSKYPRVDDDIPRTEISSVLG